jgi:hypothetical protein
MKTLTWIPILFLLASVAHADEAKATAAILKKDGKAHAAQFTDAIRVNIRPELRDELAPIVAAIRHAENGRAGREYGVLHPKALGKSYRTQAGWAAATVQKQYDRWVKAGKKGAYLESLARRYCPVGADNDPTGLNKHWLKNVTHFTKKFD